MSKSEVERFVADLKENDALREELSLNASGIGSVVEFAKDKGYDVTADEARTYLEEQVGRELNEDELDNIAGGAAIAVVQQMTAGSVNIGGPTVIASAEQANVEAVVGTQAQAAVVVT